MKAPGVVVTEDEVHEAVHFLQQNAAEIGRCRGRLVKAERYVKHVEALAAKFSDEKSAAAKKIDALASDKYLKAIEDEANAAAQFEEMKSLREAAVVTTEVWRTQQATIRSWKV